MAFLLDIRSWRLAIDHPAIRPQSCWPKPIPNNAAQKLGGQLGLLLPKEN